MIDLASQRYALIALVSAALFGVSTPLAKLLLGYVPPLLLAGLLYLGSGAGLMVLWLVRRSRKLPRAKPSAALEFGGWVWLAAAVLSGGVLAPVLLLWGLSGMHASGASLLLNAEAVLTILVAALLFGEHVSGRVWASAAVMLAGALLLAYEPGTSVPVSPHALAVAGACLLWALDNNFTRNISSGDPVLIAMVKGLVAGTANCALAAAAGVSVLAPGTVSAALALALGAASYGASLVLYIVALRHLGSARTGAHFATSPFIGAAVAITLLGEPTGTAFIASVALMLAATWLLLSEKHLHQHTHEHFEHSHPHVHDGHHQHSHTAGVGTGPHTHAHVHEPLTHLHPHLPDLHHRHRH